MYDMGISKNSRVNKNRTLMTRIKWINTDFISENQSHQCYPCSIKLVFRDAHIIIIGAGPAGISMAVEAIAAGISREKILLIEKAHEHSFSLKNDYLECKI